jgi:hypothetical protein
MPIFAIFSGRGRCRPAHQLRHHIEIALGTHGEDDRLRLVRHAESGIRIHWRVHRLVVFAPVGKWGDLVLRLQLVDGLIILVRAVSIGAAQDHHIAGLYRNVLHAGRHVAFPARAGEQIVRCRTASGTLARRGFEIVHPKIDDFEKIKAVAHVRVAEHLRFGKVEPAERIERIGVGR